MDLLATRFMNSFSSIQSLNGYLHQPIQFFNELRLGSSDQMCALEANADFFDLNRAQMLFFFAQQYVYFTISNTT